MQDVENVCCTPDGRRKALILLVPLRLGADKLNPIYTPCLTSLLTLDTCIGVIGGRPRHSLYFIGYQDDKLIHLDPHYCQVAFNVLKKANNTLMFEINLTKLNKLNLYVQIFVIFQSYIFLYFYFFYLCSVTQRHIFTFQFILSFCIALFLISLYLSIVLSIVQNFILKYN